MEIEYRSDASIRESALNFLMRYHPNDTIPVPIEEIVEFDLGLNIIPVANLKKNHGIDGALSQDFSQIYVDDYALENIPKRHRFTLAHEIGHFVLHKTDIENGNIELFEDWLNYARRIAGLGDWFETQAHIFAGYVLMPSHHFESEFDRFLPEIETMIRLAKEKHLERSVYIEAAVSAMANRLSKVFDVSEAAVKVMISRQNLGNKIP